VYKFLLAVLRTGEEEEKKPMGCCSVQLAEPLLLTGVVLVVSDFWAVSIWRVGGCRGCSVPTARGSPLLAGVPAGGPGPLPRCCGWETVALEPYGLVCCCDGLEKVI